ncbi:MAG: type IV toxin-antitoxin system AbiEi family antitoxin domain-containing protein [Planctomycetes bacterium]|nr:type IV toxin-antitoxin system AbiEi family antitoxin domain-containing protein [Planctomycetota bacterium]
MPSKVEQIRELGRRQGIIRPRDLDPLGIARSYLARLCREGVLTRVGRGLYVFDDADVTEHRSLAEAAKRVPHGVICLLSALQFHGLGTQAPFEVWMAIDLDARQPKSDHPPIRTVRMGGAARASGIETHLIEGVDVPIYSAAKTVVDCFKFRNKIGLDVAIEALREFRRENSGLGDEIWRFARICRVANVMRPYLESVA